MATTKANINSANQQAPAKPKVVITKRAGEINTPSITQALSGNVVNEQAAQVIQPKVKLEEQKPIDQPFTLERIHEIWPSFVEKFTDQVHLYNTLLNLPDLKEGNIVVINVENSVQQEKIRLMKPEMIGHLRRTLNNSTIDVRVDLIRANSETKVFTDDQKIKAMIQKNPALALLKNKFNLDFNG